MSLDGGRFPRWSPAGDELYWVSGARLMAATFAAVDPVEIGAPQRLLSTRQPGLAIYSFQEFGQIAFDVTPDGNFVVTQITVREAGRVVVVQNWTELLDRLR